jgi:phage-related protein
MIDSKPVEFRGSALQDLRAFPEAARREAGYQLDQIQRGREPDDWKPMNTVGRGVREIGFEMPREYSGCFMWRNSTPPSMCCIVSKRRRRKQAKWI